MSNRGFMIASGTAWLIAAAVMTTQPACSVKLGGDPNPESPSDAGPKPHDSGNDGATPAKDAESDADAAPIEETDPSRVLTSFDAITKAFFDPGNAQGATEGIVVRHHDAIVYEHYGYGYTAENRHLLYSVSKSVTSMLVGIAADEGLIARGDSVCKYFKPDGADPTLCDTTIEHLLHMAAGLEWVESYGANPNGTVGPMLYGSNDDMADYAARKPRTHAPGEHFEYSTGTTLMLSKVLRVALGNRDASDYAQEKLFAPAGITSAIWEKDRSGSLVGGASLFMTPRDMTLIGQVMSNKGVRNGKRILSQSWIDFSLTPSLGSLGYGAQWWLSGNASGVTKGSFKAIGFLGQQIEVLPEADLVIVRVGNDRNSQSYNSTLLRDSVLASLAIPKDPEVLP